MSELESTSASATAPPLPVSVFSTAATAATTGEEDDTACWAVEVVVEAAERERGEGGGEEARPEGAAAARAPTGLLAAPRPSLSAAAARGAAPSGRGVTDSARMACDEIQKRVGTSLCASGDEEHAKEKKRQQQQKTRRARCLKKSGR
jgi:hypothetical protein